MDKQQIKELFKKYHEGTCTEEEKAALEAWYLKFNENKVVIHPRRIVAIGKKIYRELPGNETQFIKIGLQIAAAAVTIGIMFMVALNITMPDKINANKASAEVILPGTNKATLTLSNGKKIDLGTTLNGRISDESNSKIEKTQDGRLSYTDLQNAPENNQGEDHLEVPKGGEWELTLADGSRVWLNSNSTLDFPTTFKNKKERIVYLSGEAYFEIVKDKAHPFIVRTANQDVKVLGTRFNINAYADEPSAKTTLAEGKVEIANKNGSKKTLMPGEQAALVKDRFSITQADLEETLAWKNGYFRFNDEDIQSVMRKLCRWYNFEVTYLPDTPNQRLNGKISRSKNIGQVLKALEATKTIHFKVQGRRVFVMK